MKEKREEFALEYAGFWIRLAATLIDLLVLIAGIYILYCIISQSFFWVFPNVHKIVISLMNVLQGSSIPVGVGRLLVTILLVALIVCTLYSVILWASTGQTVGKMTMGIKVIRTDSSPVDLHTAFIRYLGCLLSVATLGIGFIILAFDSHKQALHDRIADTYVVKLPVKQVVLDGSLARGRAG